MRRNITTLGGENYVRKFRRAQLAYIINAEGLVVAVKVGLLFYGERHTMLKPLKVIFCQKTVFLRSFAVSNVYWTFVLPIRINLTKKNSH